MYAIKMPRTRAAERNMTFWEISEFRKFISHVDDVTRRAFFTFQYYTGCRIGETLALQEKDYSGGAVRIDKSLSKQTLTDAHFEIKSTKTGKRRTVFMYIRLINAYLFIQRYLTAGAMLFRVCFSNARFVI